jgi:hypothetical protein
VSQDALPTPVLELVARSLASMEQIEALLLLHRTADTAWSPDDVAREMQIQPAAARTALAALAAERLASHVPATSGSDGAFQYSPETAALRAAVDQLVVAYNTRPVTLIKALYSRPPKAVTSFADAFRIR